MFVITSATTINANIPVVAKLAVRFVTIPVPGVGAGDELPSGTFSIAIGQLLNDGAVIVKTFSEYYFTC